MSSQQMPSAELPTLGRECRKCGRTVYVGGGTAPNPAEPCCAPTAKR
jgi:hypothetical protein